MKKKIYIAGKVTGEDRAKCTAKFAEAQKVIEDLGFEVVNPLDVVGDWETPWDVAMRKCIVALMGCDALVILPDSFYSNGAKIEYLLTKDLKMPSFDCTIGGLLNLADYKWNN